MGKHQLPGPAGVLALTLWPEWAWAIHNIPGDRAKRVENRGQTPWDRLVDGPWIALHAGKYIGGRKGYPATCEGIQAVAAMARLAGCTASVWAFGVDRWSIRIRTPDGASVIAGDERGGFVSCQADVDDERPILTSAILGAFRIRSVLPPGYTDKANGIRGWKVPAMYGWFFDYRPLTEPILGVDGAQGFWKVRPEHEAPLRALVGG